tara:strand:+ start:17 stop:259 length:243 start_codon:yes stop_codon:yes gene_type:complete
MPKYIYKCEECEEVFEVFHSITEKLETCTCESQGSLTRIPSIPIMLTKNNSGKIVKEYIEDTKREVEQEKRKIKTEEYEP